MARARFVVQGRVQGVGFRWFVLREARRLGLIGVARNLADGTVEVLAEGRDEAVAELARALSRGPSMAQVERVDKSDLPREVNLPNSFETD
ncbi:MAG: acylphosphatase [Gemmatimonadetes bacterium]|nr:MAG: acylphosphatase [Gemmatimonadota bacterium]